MSLSVPQILMKVFLVIVVVTLVLANAASARPHFSENTQMTSDQDNTSNMYDGDLKPWQVEALIQRLSEINNQAAWRDRNINEVKRQSRYRQCYFNPISCFKK